MYPEMTFINISRSTHDALVAFNRGALESVLYMPDGSVDVAISTYNFIRLTNLAGEGEDIEIAIRRAIGAKPD